MSVAVREVLASRQSPFQLIEILDTEVYGKMLFLDGHVQLSEFDESAYHEYLVHVPLLNISEPKRALIVGGGDGGVLREICRHPSIESIDFVEIDGDVIELCKLYMPMVNAGSFGDPRLNLHVTDAFGFVETSTDSYDLIVVDCTDVYEDEEGELSERLFTSEFYKMLRDRLSKNGFVVTQADNPVYCPYSLKEVSDLFDSVYAKSGSYWSMVPSFGGFSAYVWGSNGRTLSEKMPRALPGLSCLDEFGYQACLRPLTW
ncbi:MAG: hypothetical protein JNM34_03965 [Chthonomonadaceae bacterium]|nr:hypothetical protein [Chthonomonadaceae bacterium]